MNVAATNLRVILRNIGDTRTRCLAASGWADAGREKDLYTSISRRAQSSGAGQIAVADMPLLGPQEYSHHYHADTAFGSAYYYDAMHDDDDGAMRRSGACVRA